MNKIKKPIKKEKYLDIELQSRITFRLIHEKKVEILRDGVKVGEFWSWSPSNHPFNSSEYPYSSRDQAYTEKNGVQICGFSDISEVWDNCRKFNGKKDVVITFYENNRE